MAERAILELKAELQEAKKKMTRFQHSVESGFERIEGQQRQMNKRQKTFTERMKASAKQAVMAYGTFEGIQGVQRLLTEYAANWRREVRDVGTAAENMSDAFGQVLTQTVRAKDNWSDIRDDVEATMTRFGISPKQGWKQYETTRSVMSGEQWTPEMRKKSMRAVAMHSAMTGAAKPETLASIHARLRNMYPEYGAMELQSKIERAIAKYKLGGEELQKGLKYTLRAGAAGKSFGRGLAGQMALGAIMTGNVANPGRAFKKSQMVMRELYQNKNIKAVEGHPYPLLAGLRKKWGDPESRKEVRQKIREMTQMSDRILTVIKPTVEKLPQMVRLRKQIKEAGADDLRQAYHDVMKASPMKRLSTVGKKLETLSKTSEAGDIRMQRWSTVYDLMSGMTEWATHEKRWASPATGGWVWQNLAEMQSLIPGISKAHALKGYIGLMAGGSEKRRRAMLGKMKEMATVGGITARPVRRLQWRNPWWGSPYIAVTEGGAVAQQQQRRQQRTLEGRYVPSGMLGGMGAAPGGLMPAGGAEAGEKLEAIKQNTRRAAEETSRAAQNQERRKHSSDRAGAQP